MYRSTDGYTVWQTNTIDLLEKLCDNVKFEQAM
jgi:hypothetical protein